jgi:NADH:ubiquinone oxidoreductase subunit F (NADH-binding)/NADH:ubiquinone oxidoreductase subunit E/Pyruvate/2-oxoacid:ferredoxin oxidoreductase delta subunit
MKKETGIILSFVDKVVEEIGTKAGDVIPILHAVQKEYNYLPEDALQRICEITEITPASITGVSTFYSQFRHTPIGKHIIRVCTGTACHVKGSELVYDAFCRELDIEQDQDTDPDFLFTVQKIACLGCCTIAPVVQIDDVTYGHVKTDGVSHILQDFLRHKIRRAEETRDRKVPSEEVGEIKIGLGSCCVASGSQRVQQALEKSLAETGINTQVKRVGCVGMCHRTPLLEVSIPEKESVLYDSVKPEDVRRILLKHYKPKTLSQRIKNAAYQFIENILEDPHSNGFTRHPMHFRDPNIQAFLGRQKHIATEHSGQIDPLDLEEYRSKGGVEALERCLTKLSPDDVVFQIKSSGLRGRGGAGYPSGQKWKIVHQSQDDKRYIICNGDEGDPGAFMDRMILESYPFRVIEGMIIAAYTIGANEGYFYIRAEYPLAVHRIKDAIRQCQECGLLGEDILGKGYSLDLHILEGAGAFVCGEETALIASLEGRRGNPRYRPPYPAQKGLWGHPTLVSNCETFATVPWIIRNGADAFSRMGTEKSKGTKVFSLAGKIARGGLIEVPMGITIQEIVYDIGGGIENGRPFKAVQIGGPSGGCIPSELSHTRVDFEDLTKVGAMMGSGGLLVMDDSDCMVDIARYFLSFTQNQSCGKCTFCRVGTRHMLRILEDLCAGKGKKDDLEKLEEIAHKTKQGSLCGLGKTAPNPVLTTLNYFREEYEAHLNGICPAKRCKELITYTIDETCIGCTVCAQRCPGGAIAITPYQRHMIDQTKCVKCGTCLQVCPTESVNLK